MKIHLRIKERSVIHNNILHIFRAEQKSLAALDFFVSKILAALDKAKQMMYPYVYFISKEQVVWLDHQIPAFLALSPPPRRSTKCNH